MGGKDRVIIKSRKVYPRTLWEAQEVIAGSLAEISVSLIATGEVPEDRDTKIGDVVDSEEGYLRAYQDLDQMGQWAEEWQMEFNLDK
eukprot:g36852.t1